MKFKSLVALMMGFGLSACSGISDQALNMDLNSNSCCSTLTELPLTELSVPFQQHVVIDGELPTLSDSLFKGLDESNQQRLPILAYRIENQQAVFSLLLRSYINDKTLFAPRLIMFDAHWKQVGDYSSKHFNYQPSGLKGLERIEAIIEINPQVNDAHYVVIMPDTSILNETLERIHPAQLYAQSQQVIGQKRLPLTATYQKVGVIDVTTSSSKKSVILASLTEISTSGTVKPEMENEPHNGKKTDENWLLYLQEIDQALAYDDIKKAANIANQASEAGLPQAKDYLLKQLTK